MSDIMEYKCPACGGAMEFDSKSQKMKCPYCDSEMSVEEFQQMQQGKEAGKAADQQETAAGQQGPAGGGSWEAAGDGQWREGETDGMRVYACQSCGGEIVAEESTGAMTCPYCGNRVVMKGQFSGDMRPDYIIPFKLDKKDAKEAYHRHLQGKAFLLAVFKSENHIDEIKGVYVPFWLFDADVQASIDYKAERVEVWESGDTEYTQHEYFVAQRAGNISFQRIPSDGSRKMDDTLMEAIEPYRFEDAVPFQPAYLAGYVADRYDVDMESCMQRARERICQSTEISFKNTVEGYHTVIPAQSNISILNARYSYVLYPVWMLNTTWNGEKYTFAMNGQTGRMVGDLPADKGAFWKYVASRSVAVGAVLYALMWLVMLI